MQKCVLDVYTMWLLKQKVAGSMLPPTILLLLDKEKVVRQTCLSACRLSSFLCVLYEKSMLQQTKNCLSHNQRS